MKKNTDNPNVLQKIQQALAEAATEFDLRNNGLTSLPAEIGQLTSLQLLNLGGNELTSLPAEIGQLISLQSLDLTDNNFVSLPAEIGQLTKLRDLGLTGNQLKSLPVEIEKLISLQKLWIGHNQLKNLPMEIVNCKNLVGLYLHNNQLETLPKEICHLTALKALSLSANNFSQLPTEIKELKNLQRLNLDDLRLVNIPAAIFQLTNLQSLQLAHNKLMLIPAEILQLINLQSLDLDGNELMLIPAEILQLTNLQLLNLGGNRLTSLPAEILQLTKLQSLYLHGNELTSLPAELGQLTNLQSLNLSSNRLTSLPAELGQLTNLQSLNLSSNRLMSLPIEITKLKARLSINKNPFNKYPPEVVEQGSESILEYLTQISTDSRPQWVSKLMLVGEGGVGKTSLLRALRQEAFSDISTTRGIEIRNLPLKHPSEELQLMLNSWDFGGQEIYHATHQFFLTNRSLFLLIWNARHGYEQGKLYYWLDSIQARAPESPILVVATWTDERDADLPMAELKAKYPQIVDFYRVSNKTGAGIDELRTAIAQVAVSQLPLMGEKWPTSWLNAANALRAMEEKYITPDVFQALVTSFGVSDTGVRVLGRWLHELGDILYFRDDTELNDIVILKPEWVTKYIGRVLDSEDVIGRQGIFTHSHMKTLWGDLAPAMQQHFLRLMERFDLSYRTLEDREVSLVVERLPLDPPDLSIWTEISDDVPQNEISMKFKLNTMLPGIPTWFIAREHRFTTHTHWRMGAIFGNAEKKNLAFVQALPHDRYVQLTVRGPAPHDFFVLLRDGLELTLRRYPGLNIQRTMPCPGHDEQPCDYEFDYENLKRAIEREKPKEFIECQKALEDVSVPELLFGLHWRTQDNVLAKIDELKSQFSHAEKARQEQHDELVALLQREFAKSFYREQKQIESYCPNVFVLRPYAANEWRKLLIGEKLELQLYCQAPGCWHPTQHGGHYVFDYPPKWLRATGKYIQDMVKFLKYVTPLMGPWIGVTSEEYGKLIANDIKLMEGLVKLLPDVISIDETKEMKIADRLEKTSDPFPDLQVEGAPLRAIRLLLEKLDEHQDWGGLKLVLTPEDHYLWLCDYHAQEYRK